MTRWTVSLDLPDRMTAKDLLALLAKLEAQRVLVYPDPEAR